MNSLTLPLAANLDGQNRLTIGLPILNEEKNLPTYLNALVENVNFSRETLGVTIDVIACFNGTTDGSKEIIAVFNSDSSHGFQIKTLESNRGKFLAECTIVKAAEPGSYFLFADTDTRPHHDCYANLLKFLIEHPDEPIAYARGLAVIPEGKPETPFVRMQQAFYGLRDKGILRQRNHLVGRAFIVRDNRYHNLEEIGFEERVRSYVGRAKDRGRAIALLQLMRIMDEQERIVGSVPSDDGYLSYRVLSGQDHVPEVASACLDYFPPLTFADFLKQRSRTTITETELKKLFPEYAPPLYKGNNNHLNILAQATGHTSVADAETVAQIIMRMQIIEWIKTITRSNPLAMGKKMGFWVHTESTKSFGAFSAAVKEITSSKPYTTLFDHDSYLANRAQHPQLPEGMIEGAEGRPVEMGAVLVVLINDGGNILTVFNKRGFDLPGGKPETEENPIDVLYREVREETGIVLTGDNDIVCVGGKMSHNYKGQGHKSFLPCFAVRVTPEQEAQVLPNSDDVDPEVLASVWMPPKYFVVCHSGGGNDAMEALISKGLNVLFPNDPHQNLDRFYSGPAPEVI